MPAYTDLTAQNVLISAGLLALAWRLLKVLLRHPFDNVPGPPSASLLFGLSKSPHAWLPSDLSSLLQEILTNSGMRKDGLSIKVSMKHTALS